MHILRNVISRVGITLICSFPCCGVINVAFAIVGLDPIEDASGSAFWVHAHEDFGLHVASSHGYVFGVSRYLDLITPWWGTLGTDIRTIRSPVDRKPILGIWQWPPSLGPKTVLPALWERIKVIPAVAAQVFFYEVIRGRRLHVCEEDGTATLCGYSAFDCVQGEVDIGTLSGVETVTYSVVCAGVGDRWLGPVILCGWFKSR